ncbi:hypothetical protein [Pontibacter sp. SGAir0037]|uniref:hypothetical protein n=1 Tax=Pontibacter sp. SGAir0037 TaxID=2571030 RepID=UPI0010CCFC69|nr:hypothetical protein [Pontibacter sp. SGAir0037]QCR24990.1 hypothetical protein C1N53_09320 [Pontibacter sp. SGAir0037]
MSQIITLCYRKVIDAGTTGAWEKLVFADSYQEFKMQAQLFNQEKKYRSFAELLQHVPDASQLHFLVSAAVTGYLQQLHNTVPDILNNQGRHFLPFNQYQFEIINSDILDSTRHQVALNFYSEPLIWHHTIGTYLLVSEAAATGDKALTNLVQLQPFLSIYSLQTNHL